MTLPDNAYVDLTPDMRICRLLTGMWQVSGAHGAIDPGAAVESMVRYHDAGFTTWDMADHYGPAEEFLGEFRRRLAESRGEGALKDLRAFTKWVPCPGPMSRPVVEAAIARSLSRMGVEALDLLQFHWWEYSDEGYFDAFARMSDLVDEGRIRHLALTNFDTEHLDALLDGGFRVVSNQVQYSLIDRRPEVRMAPYCGERGVGLLAYGTLCGGLLSERFLGRPEPGWADLHTASLRKYKQMVDAWGGWGLFQDLLSVLLGVAAKHGATIGNVAVRYVLDRPAVAGVIVGARLGVSEHIADNARVFDMALDGDDHDRIEAVLGRSRDLFGLIGDCGDEYRR
ncbi:MAG: aldo/keto reductase [Dehalococcoidia bacterium]|nr:aldo/keto reductase [Dehalococcoidia bacterium]